MPYSLNHTSPAARPRVECARYCGMNENVARCASSSRTRASPTSIGACIHLWRSSARESARSSPRTASACELSARKPPMAPSTWSHSPSASARSAMASRSSTEPVLMVPADATTASGSTPADRSAAIVAARRVDVHGPVVAHRDLAQRGLPEAQQLDRLAVAAVHLGGGVDAEPAAVRHPVGAQGRADPGAAGDGEADEVGLGGAGDEEPAGGHRVAGGLRAPPDDLLLDEDRGVVGAAHVGVDDAREEVGEVADGVAGAHVPAPEAGVVVAHGVGDDVLEEVVVCRGGALGGAGERRVEEAADVVGHRAPDGFVAAAREVVERVVDHAVGEGTQGVPVLRVQAGAAVGCGVRGGRRRHPRMLPPSPWS